MKLPYYLVNVFAPTRFGGNPLAVFPEAEHLSPEQMQAIAYELHFSESTFVTRTSQGHRVQIFTPSREIPFAGHPTLGTAAVIKRHFSLTADALTLLEKVGPVEVSCSEHDQRFELKAPQTPQFSEAPPPGLLAQCLDLPETEIGIQNKGPLTVSVGLPFCMIPIKSQKTLKLASPQTEHLKTHSPEYPMLNELYLFCQLDKKRYEVRMFAPLEGIPEDPATGSAAAAFGAYLREALQGLGSYELEQGVCIKRPSHLRLRVTPREIYVSGEIKWVSQGDYQL